MYEILTSRSIIEIKGNNSLSFLQNLITNDLSQAGGYYYSYMLNPRGQYLFDFFVFKDSNQRLIIDIAKANSINFINKLNFYKLRSQIVITDVSYQYNILYSREPLPLPLIYCLKDPRYYKLGFRSLLLSTNIVDPAHDNLYLNDKYGYTIPDGESDLTFERSYIMEFGGEELNAINYNKGCYIGQEIVSRTHYQGQIRKRIFKIISEEPLICNTNVDITNHEGIKLGEYRSGFKNQGIALLKIEDPQIRYNKFYIDNKEIEVIIPSWRSYD